MEDEKKPGLTVTVVGSGRSAVETMAGLGGHLGPLPASNPGADPVGREPTLVGAHGRAWLVDQAALFALNPGGQRDGQVSNWVVEASWAHPIWHSYWVALVHLRPFPGMKGGTRIYLEGATHELWIYALSPEVPRNDFVEARSGPAFMTPKNFAAQLLCGDDGDAFAKAEQGVRHIIEGRMNPDTDGTASMAAYFGDNMLKDRPGYREPSVRPGLN